jgi:hypothetical protein
MRRFAPTRRSPPTALRPIPLVLIVLATLALAALGWAPLAAGAEAEEATWQFAPASAPPAPAGAPAVNYPVPLGQVGQISFWAPNRGLLITGGGSSSCAASASATVPCGLYAYNGRIWHQLSTVCGGANGRIAWAGPNEFWTISDQRPGQLVTTGAEYGNISLCHFLNGQVVASYAMPLDQPGSYLPMDSAACLSPNDCWFGGELGQPPNHGAFHLHWNGEDVTVVYGPADHAITSMALTGPGALYESVQLAPGDGYGSEDVEHPYVLHQIDPPGSSVDFHDVLLPNVACATLEFCAPLPEYGINDETDPVAPETLSGLLLSSDYTPSGSNQQPPQMWALAGWDGLEAQSSSEGDAHPIALRFSEGAWSQVVGGEGPGGGEPGGAEPFAADEQFQDIAAEPGSPAAWVTVHSTDGEAHVDRLTTEGKLSAQETLGTTQGVGSRGNAGAIACPAAHECWLATSQGWLFHYTDGNALPEDTDPYFAGVITYRPPDEGVPQLPPNEPPPDDSLANQLPPPPPAAPQTTVQAPTLARKALVTDLHSHVVDHDMLELSFKLTVKAHVQLLARHGSRSVAQTRRETLKAGKHTLDLRLDPHQWPTKLDLKATPLEALPTVQTSPGGGSGQTTAPPLNSNSTST